MPAIHLRWERAAGGFGASCVGFLEPGAEFQNPRSEISLWQAQQPSDALHRVQAFLRNKTPVGTIGRVAEPEQQIWQPSAWNLATFSGDESAFFPGPAGGRKGHHICRPFT